MKIRYIGPFGQRTGYGRAGLDYLLALHRYQPSVSLDIQPTHDMVEPPPKELARCIESRGGRHWADVTIVHLPPFGLTRYVTDILKPSGHTVAMTTWETCYMPTELRKSVEDHFDLILHPSMHSKICMKGLDGSQARYDQYRILPHCFEPKEWPWYGERRPVNKRFTFLYNGTWGNRKNPQGVVKAYYHAFWDREDVELVIKTHSRGAAVRDIRSIQQAFALGRFPSITLYDGEWEFESIKGLYAIADCYVTLHRGEGFCLGAFEAAISGVPLIFTGGSGIEYSRSYYDYNIESTLTPTLVTCDLDQAQAVGINGTQYWKEPNLLQASQDMQHIVAYPKERCQSIRDALETKYSYQAVSARLLKYIECL